LQRRANNDVTALINAARGFLDNKLVDLSIAGMRSLPEAKDLRRPSSLICSASLSGMDCATYLMNPLLTSSLLGFYLCGHRVYCGDVSRQPFLRITPRRRSPHRPAEVPFILEVTDLERLAFAHNAPENDNSEPPLAFIVALLGAHVEQVRPPARRAQVKELVPQETELRRCNYYDNPSRAIVLSAAVIQRVRLIFSRTCASVSLHRSSGFT
jgi:hypothetical protein